MDLVVILKLTTVGLCLYLVFSTSPEASFLHRPPLFCIPSVSRQAVACALTLDPIPAHPPVPQFLRFWPGFALHFPTVL